MHHHACGADFCQVNYSAEIAISHTHMQLRTNNINYTPQLTRGFTCLHKNDKKATRVHCLGCM